MIEQNSGIKWNDLINELSIEEERITDMDEIYEDEPSEAQELAEFRI